MGRNSAGRTVSAENRRVLERLPLAATYDFHGLLTPEELQHGEIDFEALLKAAQHQLDAFDGDIAAIVTYRDFPAATIVPILCDPDSSQVALLEINPRTHSRTPSCSNSSTGSPTTRSTASSWRSCSWRRTPSTR